MTAQQPATDLQPHHHYQSSIIITIKPNCRLLDTIPPRWMSTALLTMSLIPCLCSVSQSYSLLAFWPANPSESDHCLPLSESLTDLLIHSCRFSSYCVNPRVCCAFGNVMNISSPNPRLSSPYFYSIRIFAAPPKIGGWDPKVVITLGQDLSLRSSRKLVDPRNIDRMQQKYKTHINDDSDEKRLGVR